MKPKNEPLILLDTRGLLMRRYHTCDKDPTYQDENGNPMAHWQSGLASFLERDIIPLFQGAPPRRILAVQDGGNEYRQILYNDYKAHRKHKSSKGVQNEISELVGHSSRLLQNLGIKTVLVPGQEADDVLALLCERLTDRPLIIRTLDADLLQLVSEQVSVLLLATSQSSDAVDTLYQPGMSYKGTPVELIRLYKSIVGDNSDGYIGVKGLGEQGWKAMLQAYDVDGMQQLEECVRTADFTVLEQALQATSDTHLKKLSDQRQDWRLGYQLASLHPECCYGQRHGAPQKPRIGARVPSIEKVSEILTEIGASDLTGLVINQLPTFTTYTAENHAELVRVLQMVTGNGIVGYDFESYDSLDHEPFKEASTTGNYVDVLSQKITGISFAGGPNYQYCGYISFRHKDTANLDMEWAKWVLSYIAETPVQVVHNANFELSVALEDVGISMPAPIDTSITASYADENLEARLKEQSRQWLHYQQTTYKEVTGGLPMNELTAEHVTGYGCDDSLVSLVLFDVHRLTMELEGTWDFYLKNEVEHVKDAVEDFRDGADIDLEHLQACKEEDQEKIERCEKAIRSALETNAMRKDEQTRAAHARALLDAWWETEGLKLGQAGASPDAINEKWNTLWAKAWAESVYQPFVETQVAADFVPTPTKLTQVVQALGVDAQVEKVTRKYLNQFLFDHFDDAPAGSKQEQFSDLLAAAIDDLGPKKRSGEKYDKLVEFCAPLVQGKGKTEKVGTELNWKSAPQMTSFLYGVLGLQLKARSKVAAGSFRDKNKLSGAPATGNKAALAAIVLELQGDDNDWRVQVLKDYMEIIEAKQNISLYYERYPLWIHPRDGRIHPQIKNCGTATRRPSGTAPNVLQVSNKDDMKIKKAFVSNPREGAGKEPYCYVALDFNGQELRLTASESKDPVMLDAYIGEERKDIHSVTSVAACPIILPREGVTDFGSQMDYTAFRQGLHSEEYAKAFGKVRKVSKMINFLIIYGGSGRSLAEKLLVAEEIGNALMDSTFQLYRRLQPWQQEVAEFARIHGYVQTAYGNRRHATSDLWSEDNGRRRRMERQLVNFTIQGCAADILKIVMTEMRRRKIRERYRTNNRMPIYDEVANRVPVAAAPEYVEEMAQIMRITPPGHLVPMEPELEIGLESWGHKREVSTLTAEGVAEYLRQVKGTPHGQVS